MRMHENKSILEKHLECFLVRGRCTVRGCPSPSGWHLPAYATFTLSLGHSSSMVLGLQVPSRSPSWQGHSAQSLLPEPRALWQSRREITQRPGGPWGFGKVPREVGLLSPSRHPPRLTAL